jgi:hypothetical protein
MNDLPSYQDLPQARLGGRSAWLKDLADDCAGDGVYESFLVSAPFNAPGGIGSPANAVAIK